MKTCLQLFAVALGVAVVCFFSQPVSAQSLLNPSVINAAASGQHTRGGITFGCVPQYTNMTITDNYFSYLNFQNTKAFQLTAGSGDTAYDNIYSLGLDFVAYQGGTFKVDFKVDSNSNENIGAWLDFDGDGTFAAGEKATELDDFTVGAIGSFYVNIPANAPVGPHILRVRLANGTLNNNMSPCSNYASGQTADIVVNICGNVSPYCEPQGVSYMRYQLGSVFFKQITVGSTTINIDSLGAAFDYVSTPTVMQPGGFYSIHTTFGSYRPTTPDTLLAVAWIDYDNDTTFTEAERLTDTTHIKSNGETTTMSFTLPSNVSGFHRLRLGFADANRNGGTSLFNDPCPAFNIVAGRDFLLNITNNAGVDNLSALQQSMQISNNPGSNGYSQLTFNTQGNIKGNIVITDVTGRVLQSTPFTAANGQVTQTLQVAGISAGIYFVNVEQNGKAVGCKKWVVQ